LSSALAATPAFSAVTPATAAATPALPHHLIPTAPEGCHTCKKKQIYLDLRRTI